MTTTYETLRDRIYAILNGVTDVGRVHKQERWTVTKEDFISSHVATIDEAEQVRAWWITRVGVTPEVRTGHSQQEDYSFELRAFMGLDDSADTEQTFDTLLDTVKDTFNALRPNLGISATVRAQDPIAIDKAIRHSMVGGILCHYAVLRLDLAIFT